MESALAPKADDAHRTTRIASVRVVNERENIFGFFLATGNERAVAVLVSFTRR